MDRIDLFHIFVRVAECRSFTRAADGLHMPRSTVSTAIKQLEDQLGTCLLSRNTRRVTMTHDGELFYERCQHIITQVREAEAMFLDGKEAAVGQVSINLPERIGRLTFLPALPDLFAQYPELTVEVGLTDRIIDLIKNHVDCVVRLGALPDSSLYARRIGVLQQANVASPAYIQRYGLPQSLDDLAHHRAVHYVSPITGHMIDWSWQTETGEIMQLSLEGSVTVESADAYMACCLAGLGLIQIPAYDAAHYIASGRLVEVLPAYRARPLPMSLVYLRRPTSQRFHVFADWLVKLLKQKCCVDVPVVPPRNVHALASVSQPVAD